MAKNIIRVEGIPLAFRGLNPVQIALAASTMVAVNAVAARIRIATYPPETEANIPKPYPGRWYQRLWGPRWALKDGGIGGANTSEQLQYSWNRFVINPLEQHVISHVSYASLVQGADDQMDVHKRHGWHTEEQVVDEVNSDKAVDAAIMAALNKILV